MAGEDAVGPEERRQRVQRDLAAGKGQPYIIVNHKTSRPIREMHVDQTEQGAQERARYHAGSDAEAETWMQGRYQILNLWRPIRTIRKDPLAIADANTVHDEELVPVRIKYPHRDGHLYSVKPTAAGRSDGGQRYYYLHEQQPHEVLVFKCYDSAKDGGPRRCAHSAFEAPEYAAEPDRESIEVRALVFYGPE